MRVASQVVVVVLLALAGCAREHGGSGATQPAASGARRDASQVTIHGDDRIAGMLTWEIPPVTVAADGIEAARKRADAALAAGHLFEDAEAAIPIYLAIREQAPDYAGARAGLERARKALLTAGEEALAAAGDDIAALRRAHEIAAVARTIAPEAAEVQAYLDKVDDADQLWRLNAQAERDIRAGRLGESGKGGALQRLREALRLEPEQARAQRGLATVEAALIGRAEKAGERGDFKAAERWLGFADKVRSGDGAVPAARERVAGMRRAQVAQLRDEGLVALQQRDSDIALARRKLDAMLRIAEPGEPAAAELRERIDLVAHYGLYHPGQVFTDALKYGARGPQMVVVPHGAFRMGADEDAPGTSENEQPAHYVRFDRGFAMSRTEVTVGDFRRFVAATGYEPTATRRGHSLVYQERSGNFVRRNGVDWRSTYNGRKAGDDLPVLHVSACDAEAYANWLSEQSGQRYRLPSEAEFEYALRAGSQGRYPWGNGTPPAGSGNFTGARDVSPKGRHWRNAFQDYGDGYWGPAPAGHFAANAYGLYDMAGNVSEWVADCWHDGYRRAPDDGRAWINPGCRRRVVRGGAWASAPEQVRSTWRTPVEADTTNARIGFRVVREL